MITKDLDSTAKEIANIIEKELYLEAPVYLLFFDPMTHCFYYYGKEYYQKILGVRSDENITKAIKECLKILKQNESIKNYYLRPYKKYSSKVQLQHAHISDLTCPADTETRKSLFLHLLLYTPVSRHYGMLGMRYLTGIPAFVRSKSDMEGLQDLIEKDEVLGNYFKPFKKIIDTLEIVLLGKRKLPDIHSAIMVPLFLYGQIVAMVFVCNKDSKYKFTASDYLRLLDLCNEVSITYIKDAIEYEFLKEVLSCLPQERLRVDRAIFRSLMGLFNIVGICDGQSIYRIKKQNGKLLELWCEDRISCNTKCDYRTIGAYKWEEDKCCNGSFLIQPKTVLKMPVQTTRGKERVLNLFFNIPLHVVKVHMEHFKKALDDALEITRLTEIVSKLQESHAHDVPKTVKGLMKGLMELVEKDGSLIKNYIEWKEEYRNYRTNIELSQDNEKELTQAKLKKIISSLWLSACELRDNEKINITDIDSFKVHVPLFKMGALITILENLINNTIEHFAGFKEIKISFKKQNGMFSFTYKQKHDSTKKVQRINEFKDFLNCKNFDGQKGIGLCNIQEACDTLGANLKFTIINGSKCIVVTKGDSKNVPTEIQAKDVNFEIENIRLRG